MIVTVTLNPAVDKALEVPGFKVGAHARAEVRSLLPAGKGNNVARGIARLGGEVIASGFVGRDEESLFAGSLAEDGVETRFCAVAGRTRTNATVLDPEARTTTHLREPGFRVTDEDRRGVEGLLTQLISGRSAATVVFAGSLPPGFTPGHFTGLIGKCAEAGARVAVDAAGPALRSAVDSGAVETIKPNLRELGQLCETEVDREGAVAAARGVLGRVETVLLTMGEEGAFLLREGLTLGRRCALDDYEVGNTVGCGDAFLAGWLRGGQLSEAPAEALCRAAATGAASAASETTVGYEPGDVEELMRRCEPLTP